MLFLLCFYGHSNWSYTDKRQAAETTSKTRLQFDTFRYHDLCVCVSLSVCDNVDLFDNKKHFLLQHERLSLPTFQYTLYVPQHSRTRVRIYKQLIKLFEPLFRRGFVNVVKDLHQIHIQFSE